MQNKIKIRLHDGRTVDATPIDINQASEHWNQYLLEDGSTVRLKLVVSKVFRVDNEYDIEGNPVYSIQSTNIPSVTAPENLKRKG